MSILRNNADVRAWATCGYRWKIATQPETQIYSHSGWETVSCSKEIKARNRLSPTPGVSMQAVSLSFNGNAEFKPRFWRWLQTGKVAELATFDLFDSLLVKMRLESRSRMESGRTTVCYLGGIWRRLEPLERIYRGRFPSVDPSGRWTQERCNTHLAKVSCFFIEIFSFS